MRDYLWYRMAVLAYYRCEWTDISQDDREYKFRLTAELDRLISRCHRERVNIPNAAKEMGIFMEVMEKK
jgi:hypothetical protein